MPLEPIVPDFSYYVTNDDSPSSGVTWGTLVTASGTVHTKGAWVSLLPTISYDLYFLHIVFEGMNDAGVATRGLFDLGIGPDASNVSTICENLFCEAGGMAGAMARSYDLPLFVPAGTQLWGRMQSTVASDTVYCAVIGFGGPSRPASFPVATYIDAIGAVTATTTGTAITPGSSGAMGSYAQLTAASANDYIGITAAFSSEDTTQSTIGYVILLGLGAATEQELGLVGAGSFNTSEAHQGAAWVRWTDIPAGTRIAAKMSCTGTTDSTMVAIAYGLRA